MKSVLLLVFAFNLISASESTISKIYNKAMDRLDDADAFLTGTKLERIVVSSKGIQRHPLHPLRLLPLGVVTGTACLVAWKCLKIEMLLSEWILTPLLGLFLTNFYTVLHITPFVVNTLSNILKNEFQTERSLHEFFSFLFGFSMFSLMHALASALSTKLQLVLGFVQVVLTVLNLTLYIKANGHRPSRTFLALWIHGILLFWDLSAHVADPCKIAYEACQSNHQCHFHTKSFNNFICKNAYGVCLNTGKGPLCGWHSWSPSGIIQRFYIILAKWFRLPLLC